MISNPRSDIYAEGGFYWTKCHPKPFNETFESWGSNNAVNVDDMHLEILEIWASNNAINADDISPKQGEPFKEHSVRTRKPKTHEPLKEPSDHTRKPKIHKPFKEPSDHTRKWDTYGPSVFYANKRMWSKYCKKPFMPKPYKSWKRVQRK